MPRVGNPVLLFISRLNMLCCVFVFSLCISQGKGREERASARHCGGSNTVTSEEMSEIVGGDVKEKLSSVAQSSTDIFGQLERSDVPSVKNDSFYTHVDEIKQQYHDFTLFTQIYIEMTPFTKKYSIHRCVEPS